MSINRDINFSEKILKPFYAKNAAMEIETKLTFTALAKTSNSPPQRLPE